MATVAPSRRMRPFPISRISPRSGTVTPNPAPPRVAERTRPVVDRDRGPDHVDQLALVRRRHQHHAGQTPEIGDVVRPGMGLPVRPHEARPVHGEPHREVLDRHVVDDLVIGALCRNVE